MKWINHEVWGSHWSEAWEVKYTVFGFCVWTIDLHKLVDK